MSRVLVAEDSPTQALQVRRLLEAAGFATELATDGLAALSSLEQQIPDIIVTDLEMPRMDGLALIDAVRRDHPTVPVVLMTAYGSEEIAAQALRRGAASYVPKRHLGRDLVEVTAQILAMADPDPDRERVFASLREARFRFMLANDGSLVAPLIRRLQEFVHQMDLCDPIDQIRVAVALREAIINAIDHGNLELSSELRQQDERLYRRLGLERCEQSPYRERRVWLDVGVTHTEASFTVRDEGPGFDPSMVPDPTNPASLNRIGGRGLLLIRTLMDDVRFNATGNEITLIKRRRAPV